MKRATMAVGLTRTGTCASHRGPGDLISTEAGYICGRLISTWDFSLQARGGPYIITRWPKLDSVIGTHLPTRTARTQPTMTRTNSSSRDYLHDPSSENAPPGIIEPRKSEQVMICLYCESFFRGSSDIE